MTGLLMRPRILPPEGGMLDDTIVSCEGTRHSTYRYVHGDGVPEHYPVPAIPYVADFSEAAEGYVYIDNPNDWDKAVNYAACFIFDVP